MTQENYITALVSHARGELGLRKPARHVAHCFEVLSQLHAHDDIGWDTIAALFNIARRQAGADKSVSPQTLTRLFHLERHRRGLGHRRNAALADAVRPDTLSFETQEAPRVGSSLAHRVRDGPSRMPRQNAETSEIDQILVHRRNTDEFANLKRRKND